MIEEPRSTIKVYLNNRAVIFSGGPVVNYSDFGTVLTNPQKTRMQAAIEQLEMGIISGDIMIQCSDPENIFKKFSSLFRNIQAAGGIVTNSSDQYLFIVRHGMLDLPKGKINKGEKPDDCAIREVQEETGIDSLSIVRKLTTTYHTYFENSRRILKHTQWFLMKCNDNPKFIPQVEEDISEVKWVNASEMQEAGSTSYRSVSDLLTEL